MSKIYTPTVLTIAGSDPYSGAGIQIDAKTIHAFGAYAFCTISALTAQNSQGVSKVQSTSTKMFKAQLETLLNDVKIDAVKIGMLGNYELVKIVSDTIEKYALKNIVLDTVLVSTSGKILLQKNAIDLMVKELFPKVDLITPNLPEINTLLNSKYVGKLDEVEGIATEFFKKNVKSVLIKGGHSLNQNEAIDYLVRKSFKIDVFTTKRVHTAHTHGTGCLLSSAIATNLAKGETMKHSVHNAKEFLYEKLTTASELNFNYKKTAILRKEPIF